MDTVQENCCRCAEIFNTNLGNVTDRHQETRDVFQFKEKSVEYLLKPVPVNKKISSFCEEIPSQVMKMKESQQREDYNYDLKKVSTNAGNCNNSSSNMTDTSREQQLIKQCSSNNNNKITTNPLDNDSCACINFKVNVHREGHCKNTKRVCKMLHRPLNTGLTQHFGGVIGKYQPLLSGFSSVLNYSTVNLHFVLTFLCMFILITVIPTSEAVAVSSGHGREQRAVNTTRNDNSPLEFNSLNFLRYYGYLPGSDVETGALRTQEELVKSVKTFQKFAGLRVTGRFDDATINQMKRPRCGNNDVSTDDDVSRSRRHNHGRHRSRRYALGPSKWEKEQITYRILNYTPDLSQFEVIDSIRRAFRVWSEVTLLTFHEVYSQDADILIKFAHGYHADGYPFDGPGLILAHAFFPGTGQGGDMHFDEDEDWTYRASKGTNLFSVAAHEIGHSLGLAHSSVPGSLMYPWYQGFTQNFQLHMDDIRGIQYLYGVREAPLYPEDPRKPTQNPGEEPRTRSRPTPTQPRTRATRPYPTPEAPNEHPDDVPPDPCVSSLDAVSMFRGELFLFKGKWFWRSDENGIMDGYPVKIDRFWYGLPDHVDSIDAVYERPDDGKIVFFKGKRFWVFNGNSLDHDVPKEGRWITELGFPSDLEKVDAAFVWGYNGKTYFISGDMYWKYFETPGYMAHNYPNAMKRIWKGVPIPVDAAAVYGTVTYFFHGDQYYEFNDSRMKVRNGPKSIARDWLGCKEPKIKPTNSTDEEDSNKDGVEKESVETSSGKAWLFGIIGAIILLLIVLCLVVVYFIFIKRRNNRGYKAPPRHQMI